MPSYIALVNWTGTGAQNATETVNRARQVRTDFERRGITRFDTYWTQGRYDIVAFIEGPDEETVMAALVALAKRGTVRTETLRAFAENEMEAILQKV